MKILVSEEILAKEKNVKEKIRRFLNGGRLPENWAANIVNNKRIFEYLDSEVVNIFGDEEGYKEIKLNNSIADIRKSTGMTQVEFGEYLNIPPRTIQNWEGGRREPADYVVELIEYKIKNERKMKMYKLILKEQGQEEVLAKGTVIELVKYLKGNYYNLFSWIDTDHNSQLPDELEKVEMPGFDEVETLDELEHELEKVDMDWWTLAVEEI